MRYAYCKEGFRYREYCYWMPESLFYSDLFFDVSLEACALYAYLLHAQAIAGRTDKKGYRYLRYEKGSLSRITKKSEEETRALLTSLSEEGAGLIKACEEEGATRIYVKDYTRPILPPRAKRRLGRY